MHEPNKAFQIMGGICLGGICLGVSVQGVSVQEGRCLWLSVREVHVRRGFVLSPHWIVRVQHCDSYVHVIHLVI